jgi:plastocyanin
VRLRTLLLFPVVALMGAAVVVLPALAASSEAKIEVATNCGGVERWQCFTIAGGNPEPADLTVTPGTTVTFADHTSYAANITWEGAVPTCSGVPVNPAPAATGWEGTCKFEQAGTYRFEDAQMYYPGATVEVKSAATGTTGTTGTTGKTGTTSTGTTTGTTTGTKTGTTTTGGSGTSSAPAGAGSQTQGGVGTPLGSLLVGGSSAAVKLGASEHGTAVHGALDVAPAAAGGRLEVALLARVASLASAGHSARVRVGRIVRSSLHAGAVTFSVPLDARARRALRLDGHLALTVEITLSAAHGAAATLTRGVVVRA